MKLLFFFIDGLGLGADDDTNPATSFLQELTGKPFVLDSAPSAFPAGILQAADATGGVDGRPQSATGQASLMTGVNAQGILGYHLTALPNAELVGLVEARGLMKTLAERGVAVTASNLYTPEFFEHRQALEDLRGRNSLPVSALTIRSSGSPFRMPEDYRDGRALFTDLTNRFLRDRGYDIPLITPREAAENMTRILDEADFVFHEYFATDTYAHKQKQVELRRALDEIDLFLRTLREMTDPEEVAILVVSDHGNCEDSLSADHNRNPVPILLLSRSPDALRAFDGVSAIEEVRSAVLAFFGESVSEDSAPPAGSDWV